MSDHGSHPVAGDGALRRAVGFSALTASIVNVTIGASIFALPGALAAAMGPAAPLAFVFGGLLFVPIVLCFAAAGSRVTVTGGPYSYVDAAFGRFPGYAVATFLWLSNVAGSGSLSAALADQVSHLYPSVGQPLPRAAFLLVEYGLLVTLNVWGVRVGAAAIMAFAAAKVIPLMLLVVFGAQYVQLDNLRIHDAPSWASIGSSLVIVVFAYSGIETALTPSGEVRNPSRVVPRAAFAGVAVVIALYVGLQAVAQGVLGVALAGNNAPLATVADIIMPAGGGLLVLTAAVSLVGCLQGDLLGSSRLLYALARDGFLPASLATVSERHRVPVRAVLAHAVAAWALASVGSFTALALVSGGAFCLVYIGVSAAASRLQRVDARASGAPFPLPGGIAIPVIGIAGLLLILASLRQGEWLAIGSTAVAVSLLYAITRWSRHE